MKRYPPRLSSQGRRPALHRLSPLCAALLLAITGTPANVDAATIIVTDPGDGPVESATTCTLRQAVISMNTSTLSGDCVNGGDAFGNGDTILFAPDVDDIELADAPDNELHVTRSALTIDAGSERTVSIRRPAGATHEFGLIFGDQGPTGSLNLSGLELRNGSGAHEVDRNLWKYHVQGSAGGAVYASGDLHVTRSTITGNSADFGGGLVSDGSLTLESSRVENNISGLQGALLASTAYIGNSSITGNTGMGISAGSFYGLVMRNSTVSGNVATGSLTPKYLQFGSTLVFGMDPSFAARFYNSTITCNSGIGAAIYNAGAAPLSLESTIVSNAHQPVCEQSTALDVKIPQATLTITGSGNLVRRVGQGISFSDETPLDADPLLLPLANNHGHSLTHALATGSPAIDAGVTTAVPWDQRGIGYPRSVGSTTDIGAFEYGTPFDDGACGATAASWPATLTILTPDLCSIGSPLELAGAGPWDWLCGDASGGIRAVCRAGISPTATLGFNKPISGTDHGLPQAQYVFGEPASLEVSLNGHQPVGSVDFFANVVTGMTPGGSLILERDHLTCAEVPLVAAAASCIVDTTIARGRFYFDAQFASSDPDYADTVSIPVSLFIGGANTDTLIIGSDPGTAVAGQPFFVGAQVLALPPSIATPTGTITINNLTDSTHCAFDVNAVSGCYLTATSAGAKSLRASFSFGPGLANFLPSTSPVVEWVVGEAPPDMIFTDSFEQPLANGP